MSEGIRGRLAIISIGHEGLSEPMGLTAEDRRLMKEFWVLHFVENGNELQKSIGFASWDEASNAARNFLETGEFLKA